LNYGVAGPDFGGSLAIADLDGDGSLDIAVTGLASVGTISILLNMRNSAAVPPRASASPAFALAGARPNPSGRNMEVVFTLTSTNPTTLELLDIAGRRVVARQVGSLGAGVHHVSLAGGRQLPPGLYFIRLSSGAQMLSKRVTVLP
jgi:hypothetical protein